MEQLEYENFGSLTEVGMIESRKYRTDGIAELLEGESRYHK